MKTKSILIVEPYCGGSHKEWILGLKNNLTTCTIDILSLPVNSWKWRMEGGAVELAVEFNKNNKYYDLLLFSSMANVSAFLALADRTLYSKTAIYFHENQFDYPLSPNDKDRQFQRDLHYQFINYLSALCSDKVFFNSLYNENSFLDGCEKLLKKMPDYRGLENLDNIQQKSEVLHLGIDLIRFDKSKDQLFSKSEKPVILWNHRGDYDKNPLEFFQLIESLKEENLEFDIILTGKRSSSLKKYFLEFEKEFRDNIKFSGYAESFEEYAQLLKLSDILPVTSYQDFFGISIAEALYCGVIPLLPNRLSYTELYFTENTKSYFYDDFNDLKTKTTEILKNIGSFKTEFFKERVSEFDWTNMRESYRKSIDNI